MYYCKSTYSYGFQVQEWADINTFVDIKDLCYQFSDTLLEVSY